MRGGLIGIDALHAALTAMVVVSSMVLTRMGVDWLTSRRR